MMKYQQLALAQSQQFHSGHYPTLARLFQGMAADEMLCAKTIEQLKFTNKQKTALLNIDCKKIEQSLAWERQCDKHFILYYGEKHYPKALMDMRQAPLVVYAKGNLNLLDNHALAIVGSRNPSPTGCDIASRFASQLSQQNITVISGLAKGIDGAAHTGALKNPGKTIAILGAGFNHIYPRQHLDLAEEISHNGLLLSHFSPHTPPLAHHFPERNALISALSLGVIVVEAALKSGSLITARLSAEMGKDVFAIPSSIFNPLAKGTHQLIKEGAMLVDCIEDILENFSFICQSHLKQENKKSKKILENHLQNLVECVGYEATAVDCLLARSGLSLEELLSSLVYLELEGHIKTVTGGYTRV